MQNNICDENYTWNKYKRLSSWHFDETLKTIDYQLICQFNGDWSEGLSAALKEVKESKIELDYSRIHEGEESYEELCIRSAGNVDNMSNRNILFLHHIKDRDENGNYIIVNNYKPVYDPFYKIAELLGVYDLYSLKIVTQKMGQMTPMHIDHISDPKVFGFIDKSKDISNFKRFLISLTPWTYGQIWQIGNSYWTQFKSGECITFDLINVPHGTANLGFVPRINLEVTGFVDGRHEHLPAVVNVN